MTPAVAAEVLQLRLMAPTLISISVTQALAFGQAVAVAVADLPAKLETQIVAARAVAVAAAGLEDRSLPDLAGRVWAVPVLPLMKQAAVVRLVRQVPEERVVPQVLVGRMPMDAVAAVAQEERAVRSVSEGAAVHPHQVALQESP